MYIYIYIYIYNINKIYFQEIKWRKQFQIQNYLFSENFYTRRFRKINSFGFGIAFSILFLGNKSCFYIVLVDESDLQRDKVANILHNFVWYIYIYVYMYILIEDMTKL